MTERLTSHGDARYIRVADWEDAGLLSCRPAFCLSFSLSSVPEYAHIPSPPRAPFNLSKLLPSTSRTEHLSISNSAAQKFSLSLSYNLRSGNSLYLGDQNVMPLRYLGIMRRCQSNANPKTSPEIHFSCRNHFRLYLISSNALLLLANTSSLLTFTLSASAAEIN